MGDDGSCGTSYRHFSIHELGPDYQSVIEKALLYFVWLYICSQAANTHAHHVRRKLISDLFFILLKGFSLSQYIQYIHSLYDRDFSF